MSTHGEKQKTIENMDQDKTNIILPKTSANEGKTTLDEENTISEPASTSALADDETLTDDATDGGKIEGTKEQHSGKKKGDDVLVDKDKLAKSKVPKKDNDETNSDVEGEDHKDPHSDMDNDCSSKKEKFTAKKKTENKEKNGNIEVGTDKTSKSDENGEEEDKENNDSILTFSAIPKINENINKTRVDGLQTLYSVCFGTQGKYNVVKKNLRAFSGFEFKIDSTEYKKKLDCLIKIDAKSLRGICEILSLDRKGAKEDVAERVLKFLSEPNESVLIEITEDGEEQGDEEKEKDVELRVEHEEELSEGDNKRKRKRGNPQSQGRGFSGKNSTSRPRRATAGKKMSAYVDFSSSEESVQKAPVLKRRRRNDDSESGSDYNPSGANSDSDAGRGKRQLTRGSGRGRPAKKAHKRNSDSEEDESDLSDADSDTPKRKRSVTVGKGRGRPPAARTTVVRGRREAAASRKRNDSESEEASEEEASDLESDRSEEDSKKKKIKKAVASPAPLKNNKSNNKIKTSVKPSKSKKSKKESSDEEDPDDKDESENEPLKEKGSTFPTDDDIKNFVKKILDKANLEEITMKTVCKKVYARYPDFDLTEKKDFIKATVKALIAA